MCWYIKRSLDPCLSTLLLVGGGRWFEEVHGIYVLHLGESSVEYFFHFLGKGKLRVFDSYSFGGAGGGLKTVALLGATDQGRAFTLAHSHTPESCWFWFWFWFGLVWFGLIRLLFCPAVEGKTPVHLFT